MTDSQPPTAQVALAKPFLHKIEQRLWELGLVLPIWQETLLEARGTRISNPTASCWVRPRWDSSTTSPNGQSPPPNKRKQPNNAHNIRVDGNRGRGSAAYPRHPCPS
ncbi:MAG: hypothetical protein U1U88_000495 [Lawsonella clevelandensis]